MKVTEQIVLSENLVIYPRPDRDGNFYARIKIKGQKGYFYRSTNTADEQKAKEVAREIYYKLQFQNEQGVLIGKDEFELVYRAFESEVLFHKSAARRTQFEGTFRRYFLPFFGKQGLASIKEPKIRAYWDFRINYATSEIAKDKQEKALKRKRGPKPKEKLTKRRSTLANIKKPSLASLRVERGLLNEFFRFAQSKGYINYKPKIEIPSGIGYDKNVTGRRDHFTLEEMRILRAHLRKIATEKPDKSLPRNNGRFSKQQKGQKRPHKLHLYQRSVLRELVLILANTGLRIGEALALKWSDLKMRKTKSGYPYLYLTVRVGKTGAREVIPKKDAAEYFSRLKSICSYTEKNDWVFQNAYGTQLKEPGISFKKVLKELDLLNGPTGNRRSLYSLRHTYITNELELGDVTIYQIAQNVGTSLQYIEKHYSHANIHRQAFQYAEKGFENKKADEALKNLFE